MAKEVPDLMMGKLVMFRRSPRWLYLRLFEGWKIETDGWGYVCLVKVLPKLVASAIDYKGVVFTGVRHNEIISDLVKLGYPTPIPNHYQGFIDDKGNFYNRKDARELAKRSGQISQDFSKVLTSEDLW